jgi:hypothetical protein
VTAEHELVATTLAIDGCIWVCSCGAYDFQPQEPGKDVHVAAAAKHEEHAFNPIGRPGLPPVGPA